MRNLLGLGRIIAIGLVVPILASGCIPTLNIQEIQGNVPAANAKIFAKSISGSLLGETTSGEDGSYNLQIPTQNLDNGIIIEVSDLSIDDVALQGYLAAIFPPGQKALNYDVGFATTLLHDIASANVVDGIDLFDKYNHVIELIDSLGLINASEISYIEPSTVDIDNLLKNVLAVGIQTWTQSVISDLADDDLVSDTMLVFPYAHGGIVEIQANGSGFPGQKKLIPIQIISTSVLSKNYSFELVQAPFGMNIHEDNIEYTIPSGASPSDELIELKVTNNQTGKGRISTNKLEILKGEVLAEGIVGPEGGVVSDWWDETVVDVPANALSQDVLLQIVKGISSEGNEIYSVLTAPPNTPLDNTITFTPPEFKIPNDDYVMQKKNAPGVIQRNFARFTDDAGLPDNRLPNGVAVPADVDTSYRSSSQLLHLCETSNSVNCNTKEPVIFVHGYTPSLFGMGGGKGTWGQFLEEIQASGYDCYEFQFTSAARFQDIAFDLSQAIKLINKNTKQKVHIVAHSFGGLVARTYLQNLAALTIDKATDTQIYLQYADNVASLTTVGTPHSGIFGSCTERNGEYFPDGKGAWTIEMARQLSVYQAGENVHLDKTISDAEIKALYHIENTPGEIPIELSNLTQNLYPSVPTQVLVGLERFLVITQNGIILADEIANSDGLITYQGQRFHPSFSSNDSSCIITQISNDVDSNPNSAISGIVHEKLLGLDDNLQPGDNWPNGGTSFSHTSGWPIKKRNSEVNMDNGDTTFETFQNVIAWLKAHPANDVYAPVFTINGRVLNAFDLSPIAGANVQAIHNDGLLLESTVTDNYGNFQLPVTYSGSGDYSVFISASNYHARKHDINLNLDGPNADSYQVGDIFLYEESGGRGSLSGFVVDDYTSDPIASANIQITNGSRIIDVQSNVNGYYFVPDLAAGTWKIFAQKSGYQQFSGVNVIVLPNTANDGPIYLTPINSGSLDTPEVYTYDPDEHGWEGNVCATIVGYVSDTGGARILEMQLGWGRYSDGSDWEFISGGTVEHMNSVLDGLQPGTGYYVQAYARNAAFPETWSSGYRKYFATDSRSNLADLGVPASRNSTTQGFTEGHSYYRMSGFRNLGDVPIEHAVCRIYIALDSDWYTGDDYFLEEFEVFNIPACGTQWVRTDFIMPNLSDSTAGQYNIKFSSDLDIDDEVIELNEQNTWQDISWYTAIDADLKSSNLGVIPMYYPNANKNGISQSEASKN